MRIEQPSGKAEDVHKILAAMVDNRAVLSRICLQWTGRMFVSTEANRIGEWCVEHYRSYGDPPGDEVRGYYRRWRETVDEASADLVERMLKLAWKQRGKKLAVDYVLDLAREHFNLRELSRMAKQVQDDLERDDHERAYQRVAEVRRISLGSQSSIRSRDAEKIVEQDLEDDMQDNVVDYKGAVGEFFEGALARDTLISFMAPDKMGKSFWLLDVVYRAARQGRKVALFECGDMGRKVAMCRLYQRAVKRPLRPRGWRVPNSYEDGYVDFTEFPPGDPVQVGEVMKVFSKIDLRIVTAPASTLSVEGIHDRLQEESSVDDWVPDVIVIDYADILAPPTGVKDTLDQIDETWKQLRRLSQEWHALVVTATQSSARAYQSEGRPLRRMHFSGRKTKLAHVNGMVAITATQDDQKKGVNRLNWVVRRDSPFDEGRQVFCAGCLSISNPVIRSTWIDHEPEVAV